MRDGSAELEAGRADDTDYETLAREIMMQPEARAAAKENAARRGCAEVLRRVMDAHHMGVDELAHLSGVRRTELRRLLHEEVGGPLSLSTLFRVVEWLGLEVELRVRVPVHAEDE